jgi:hypothetical protein
MKSIMDPEALLKQPSTVRDIEINHIHKTSSIMIEEPADGEP